VTKAVPRSGAGSSRAVRRRKEVAKRWWKCEQGKAHADVWSSLVHIRKESQYRLRFDRHHMQLYSNQNVAGNGSDKAGERVRFNIIAQAIDTAVAQIGTQKPKPMYLTSEGNFSLQRQARLRTRVLEGQLYDKRAYEIMPEVFRDACILGSGFIYCYLNPDTGEPEIERALPGTVWVDPRDGLRRDPLCLYYRIPVAKDVLHEMGYEVDPAVIDQAAGPDSNDRTDLWLTQDSTCDDAMVVFAWRRPSTPKSQDGRLVISTSAGTLLDTEWKWSIPFVRVDWKTRQLGYYGQGIAEAGRDPQARILKMIARGERMLDLGGNAWVLLDRNAKIRTEKLTNEPLIKVHYEGTAQPPVIQAFNAKPVQIEEEVQIVREQFFSELGLNTLQSEGKKPSGLDSGAAQRTYHDIASQRHQVQAQAFQEAYMELVRKLEELNERAAEADESYSVTARTQRGRLSLVSQVKWSEVRLPENQYRLTCWPTSLLPSTPAGKMAMVQEWIASGFISRPYAQQLALDLPDTDQAARMELADLDCVMHDCEKMLDGGEAYPEAYQNLQLAADIARRAYLQIKDDAPEPVCEAFRNYINDCMDMLEGRIPDLPSAFKIANQVIQPPGATDPTMMGASAPMTPTQPALPAQGPVAA
jgi:uncharacterized protein YukE